MKSFLLLLFKYAGLGLLLGMFLRRR